MGAEKSLALIEKMRTTEAILITSKPNHDLIKTKRVKKYTECNN